ncbi:MAG: hypothetical protein IRY94_18270, partial [Rhodospirillaceae bacterium]|nr:hypothetical protein [Rhodospirillaceae bacterium]
VPDRYKLHAHHWLILHGRYVCTARRPKCPACIVNDLCAYPAKTLAQTEPAPAAPRGPDGAGRTAGRPALRAEAGRTAQDRSRKAPPRARRRAQPA